MAVTINTYGELNNIEPRNGKDFSLEELQEVVGGYIEIVELDNGELLVCDEEGKLKGKEYNEIATFYFRKHSIVKNDDYIVGKVLICNKQDIK